MPTLLHAALDANRAYVGELEAAARVLEEQEREINARVQTLQQRLALRRAERAMSVFGISATSQTVPEVDVFAYEPDSRYKRVGVVPRSYIRQKPSFFSDAPDQAPKKRGRKPKAKANVEELAGLAEPKPNADTIYLRQNSHQSFVATPPKAFSSREREIVRNFAMQHLPNGDTTYEIPLSTWNRITQCKPVIHRSGFACKIQWELYENPSVRRCEWTVEEDRALKKLATGHDGTDPSLINNWAAIAANMPIPGRLPVQCLIRYQTKLCTSNLHDKFTAEEDEMIRQGVEVFGERWTAIADLMDGRIAEQVRHRWLMSLAPDVKFGKFSVVEDRRLLLALYAYYDQEEQPFRVENIPWHEVIHHLPGRPAPPVRDRFVDSLNPKITFRPWTSADDDAIKQYINQCGGFDTPGLWPRLAQVLGDRNDTQVARRARFLMPTEYALYQQTKLATESSLPTIFNQPITRKRKRLERRQQNETIGGDETEPVVELVGAPESVVENVRVVEGTRSGTSEAIGSVDTDNEAKGIDDDEEV